MKSPSLVHDYLLAAAERFPDREALVQGERRVSYAELRDAAQAMSAWLVDRGLRLGDRVGLLTDDAHDYVAAYFGVMMAGGTVVALNTQTTGRWVAAQLERCQVSIVVTHRKLIKVVTEAAAATPSLRTIAIGGGNAKLSGVECVDLDQVLKARGASGGAGEPWALSPSAIAQIIFTSGTTAEPHGVMLRHSNLIANTESIVRYLRLTERDRLMAVLPFSYAYGTSLLLTHVAVGGLLVVNQSFLYPNTVLEQMIAERVTGLSGVPSTFAILLNHSAIRRHKFPDLRYLTQAGGPMPPKLGHDLKTILPGVDVYVMYGQTEASARLSYLDPADLFRKAGSVGKAIAGVTLRVVDPDGRPVAVGEVGEIVATGNNIMAGYWGEPELTAAVLKHECLWTGDLGRFDDEGYLYIVGRQGDIIKSGSYRISPREVENALVEHPAVHEAAVVGVPDAVLGEATKAYVVLRDGASVTEHELLAHCRKQLPAYMVPQRIKFLAELPKTTSGKIRAVELKARG